MKNYWIICLYYLHKKDHRSVKTKRTTLTLSTSGSPSSNRRHVIEPAMVTSRGRWTPSLFSSSSSSAASAAVASTVIAFLLLTSIHETNCSPARFHHRNISNQVDHHHLQPRPPSSHSSPANQSVVLLLAPLHHRMVRRGSGSSSSSNTPKIACYACTYLLEEDYTSGVECNDPFNSATIPEVMCAGFCHKMKKKLHQGGLMLVRGCLQTCQEKVDEHGYRHCCKSKLCNNSVSLNSANNAIKIICSIILCLFFAVRLNSFG